MYIHIESWFTIDIRLGRIQATHAPISLGVIVYWGAVQVICYVHAEYIITQWPARYEMFMCKASFEAVCIVPE